MTVTISKNNAYYIPIVTRGGKTLGGEVEDLDHYLNYKVVEEKAYL